MLVCCPLVGVRHITCGRLFRPFLCDSVKCSFCSYRLRLHVLTLWLKVASQQCVIPCQNPVNMVAAWLGGRETREQVQQTNEQDPEQEQDKKPQPQPQPQERIQQRTVGLIVDILVSQVQEQDVEVVKVLWQQLSERFVKQTEDVSALSPGDGANKEFTSADQEQSTFESQSSVSRELYSCWDRR